MYWIIESNLIWLFNFKAHINAPKKNNQILNPKYVYMNVSISSRHYNIQMKCMIDYTVKLALVISRNEWSVKNYCLWAVCGMCLELWACGWVVVVADDLVDGVECAAHHLVDELCGSAAAVLVHLLHDALLGAVDGTAGKEGVRTHSLWYTGKHNQWRFWYLDTPQDHLELICTWTSTQIYQSRRCWGIKILYS